MDSPHIMVDSNSKSDSNSPVMKKAKYAGAAKYKSKFKKDWIVKYHCNVCNHTLSCVHQGEADLKRHIASDGHTALTKEQAKQPAITSILKQPNSNIQDKVRIYSTA